MAIAVDASSNAENGSTTSLSWSHTCSGSQRCLIVGVLEFSLAADVITGVTYAGVAMTLVGKVANAGGQWVYLFRLANPASGANNIVVSASSADWIQGYGVSYTGVHQSSPIDASATATDPSTAAFTITLTTSQANCWLVSAQKNNAGATSAGASTTVRANNAGNGASFGDSNAARSAGSNSLNYTCAAGAPWAGVMAALAPAPPSQFRMFAVFP